MKKAGRIIALISALLICVALNVILFLTVPEERASTKIFWICWSFTFPLNIAAFLGIYVWTGMKGRDSLIQATVSFRISSIFFFLFVLFSGLMIYLPQITTTTIPIIGEVVLTVAYLIVAMFAVFGSEYIMQSEKATKRKVLFVKMLQCDIENLVPLTTDAQVSSALSAFAEKIRLSDPMSHPSLAGIEDSITATVQEIALAVSSEESEKILALIKKGEIQLQQRNNRCVVLK